MQRDVSLWGLVFDVLDHKSIKDFYRWTHDAITNKSIFYYLIV